MAQRLDREGFRELLEREVLAADDLIQVVASARAGRGEPARRLVVRFFGEAGARKASATRFLGKRQVEQTTHAPGELVASLLELVIEPYESWSLERAERDLHVRRTKKGVFLASEGRPAVAREVPVGHDRVKEVALSPDDDEETRALLHAIGLASREGRVLPGRERKLRQVNQFVRLAEEAVSELGPRSGGPLRILDAGCGAAYLTFALVHRLRARGPLEVLGVDVGDAVLERARAVARELHVTDVRFERRAIRDVVSEQDVVLSLHACDTATDEAIARGVALRARAVLCVPCCQHELHKLVRADPLAPLLRHGILRERFADLATDALRAQRLRVEGFRAEVVEFIDQDATMKNVLIRAVRKDGRGRDPDAQAQLEAMKRFLGLEGPLAIESLLDAPPPA